jgi:hypothetical protein
MAKRRRVCALSAQFHVGELIAQRAQAASRQIIAERDHGWVLHSRTGSVAEHDAGALLRGTAEQTRHLDAVGNMNAVAGCSA